MVRTLRLTLAPAAFAALAALLAGCADKPSVPPTPPEPARHGDHDHEPHAKPADDAEMLYLTPGGKYTEADIKANGGVVAAVKFKGIKATHDVKPKPGDVLCPVSMTKANPKFTWVIDGKPYQFCCPPCVDEFVATAKEKPDELKEPEFYRKK